LLTIGGQAMAFSCVKFFGSLAVHHMYLIMPSHSSEPEVNDTICNN